MVPMAEFLQDRDLRDILFLHGLQRVENSLIGARNHQFADFAGLPLGVDDFRGGDGHAGVRHSRARASTRSL